MRQSLFDYSGIDDVLSQVSGTFAWIGRRRFVIARLVDLLVDTQRFGVDRGLKS